MQLQQKKDRYHVWKGLVAMFAFPHSLSHSLNKKVVHVNTDNKACDYVLLNMPAKLSRPDLHLTINETSFFSKIDHWFTFNNQQKSAFFLKIDHGSEYTTLRTEIAIYFNFGDINEEIKTADATRWTTSNGT